MCIADLQRIYFEKIAGIYYLCDQGEIHPFDSKLDLELFVEDINPDAELIEVTPENWRQNYDEGNFHA